MKTDHLQLYKNTAGNRMHTGASRLPEHWNGDPTSSHFLHDTKLGIFVFFDCQPDHRS